MAAIKAKPSNPTGKAKKATGPDTERDKVHAKLNKLHKHSPHVAKMKDKC